MEVDPVSNALTAIRNALMARHPSVVVKKSKFIFSILNVLKEEGYIEDIEEVKDSRGFAALKVSLKYYKGKPVINTIERISKPGRRVYRGVEDLPRFMNGLGIVIVSTSKGVLTDRDARKNGVGGEVIAAVG
ncbi:MAG: 30S ribosomal protein S8 [Candidatus Dadabacteria bacterium]|nr:MAG: 30S ribosomal protein S8 [Candidatus Dadabacteria bacterium]